ncbi:MAG: acetolactate synthase small subunit [Barnesiella sp.]|nr:acetolactate synthase small subunit [Barnesiella sp.]MDE6081406.1 acetolactate synthase small subunit [Muribaculaceae bacterium]
MEQEKELFTVSVFSENTVGLLSQVALIYTRRCINIESISASTCSIPGVHKWTITSWSTRPVMEKLVLQIEKCIDVLKAFLYTDEEIVYQEVALYKVDTSLLLDEPQLEDIIRKYNARILDINRGFTVIEKTGHNSETTALFDELKRYNLRQFVRSGRVTITKSEREFVSEYIEKQNKRKNDTLQG